MDWKDALSQLQASTPDLQPTAVDTTAEATEPTAAKPLNPLKAAAADQRGKLVIEMERKGRGGKTATIVSGFTIYDDAIDAVATHLKKTLGTGGSARGGEILIQGDRRDAVREALRREGFKTN